MGSYCGISSGVALDGSPRVSGGPDGGGPLERVDFRGDAYGPRLLPRWTLGCSRSCDLCLELRGGPMGQESFFDVTVSRFLPDSLNPHPVEARNCIG